MLFNLFLLLSLYFHDVYAFATPSPVGVPTTHTISQKWIIPNIQSFPSDRNHPLFRTSLFNNKNNNEEYLYTERIASNQLMANASEQPTQWVDESKHVELVGLLLWMASVSTFILVNNFVGPWPNEIIHAVPERLWFLFHMLGGMLFGGGVLLTTAIEFMVARTKNYSVMVFWFDKVPLVDMAIVLPGLTLAIVSGISLAVQHYGSLGTSPLHIQYVFWALVTFASWWGITDLTTQGSALNAVYEYAGKDGEEEAPAIVMERTISNVVSCLLVLVLYGIMVLKPGAIHF